MTDGLSEPARRVDELDDVPARAPLLHFLRVMSTITSTGDERVAPCVSVAEADEFVRHSRLLRQLANEVPALVTGPLRLDAQYWIGTVKPGHQVAWLTPAESAFVRVSAATRVVGAKPWGAGLFTATGSTISPHGMWRLYGDGGTVLRHVWEMGIRDRPVVREVTTASEWVDFVLSHARRDGELLFPDWAAVARHYDAIHVTLRAIAAIQGLSFPTAQGIVAPSYWDLETTVWLHWCFNRVRLVEVVPPECSVDSPLQRVPLTYPAEPRVAWIPGPRDDLDPQQLLAALAVVSEAAREERPYPSFSDVARATGRPHREARALLLRLEELGWARPPDSSGNRRVELRSVEPEVAVRSAVLALANVLRPTPEDLRRRLAQFDRELVDRVVEELLAEGSVHLRDGRWLWFGPPPE